MLLRHIRYFLAVAECRNFTRASEMLHVSQPTLSQQIRQLEDMLGAQLFDRSGRAVVLTDAGEAWLRHAKRVVQTVDVGMRAIQDVGELKLGYVRFATTPTFAVYLVGPLLDRFYRAYPGIRVAFQAISQAEIEALLADDKLDFGVAFEPALTLEVEREPLFDEPLSFVVGAEHARARQRKPLDQRAFAQEPLVAFDSSFATRGDVDRYCAEVDCEPNVVIEVDSIAAIVETVKCGQLGTVLPRGIVVADPSLRAVELEPPLPTRRVCVLQRKGAYRTAASQALLSALREWVAQMPIT